MTKLAIWLGTLACIGLPSFAACAKEFNLPDDKDRLFTVDLPNSWTPEETEEGADATSEDGEIYVSVEVLAVATEEDAVGNAVRFLVEDEKLKLIADTREMAYTRLGPEDKPFAALQIRWDATDQQGTQVQIALSVSSVTPGRYLTFIYWGPRAIAGENARKLASIYSSLRPK